MRAATADNNIRAEGNLRPSQSESRFPPVNQNDDDTEKKPPVPKKRGILKGTSSNRAEDSVKRNLEDEIKEDDLSNKENI